jgi:protein translocase SecG subunit
MIWIIGLLTAVLVVDSLFLILLVLVQLPKKEAGIGQAFGGTATDALFGAGSGNALTKMTKYATAIFFALTLIIYLMYNHRVHSNAGSFANKIQEVGKEPDATTPKDMGKSKSTLNSLINTNLATNTVATTNNRLLTAPLAAPGASTTSGVTNAPAPAPASPTPAPK